MIATPQRATAKRVPFLARVCCLFATVCAGGMVSHSQEPAPDDPIRDLQRAAIIARHADWGYWGVNPLTYSGWTSHSNRLIPVYTYGITLDVLRDAHNPYHHPEQLQQLYGRMPENTIQPSAEYFDQTGIYQLQRAAVAAGKKQIIVMVFDGMDWQTTQAAAVFAGQKTPYTDGRGTGLAFQDYDKVGSDFGFCVTSPWDEGTAGDVDAQVVKPAPKSLGGYDPALAGWTPWDKPTDPNYLIAKGASLVQAYTDSASSATSLFAGIKTYNAAINVAFDSGQAVPIARDLQAQGWSVGVVTSVPFSHATPAAAYANNVERDDYQDLSRDLLGLPSIAHREQPLPGMDVVIGTGFGVSRTEDAAQGLNFIPGNRFLAEPDLAKVDIRKGGKYNVAMRTPGSPGGEVLRQTVEAAAQNGGRLFGFFGTPFGHLPFQTANGDYLPTIGAAYLPEVYSAADVQENPTLAEMTQAALHLLSRNKRGFWLMVEAGDVDWANHDNNLDNSMGAVLSGDRAFQAIAAWCEQNGAWETTAVIVTADHGHMLNLIDPAVLIPHGPDTQ